MYLMCSSLLFNNQIYYMEQTINQDFFKRVNKNKIGDDNLKLSLATDSLKNILTKEIKFKDLNERLMKSRQEKVLVKEIVIESEIEFLNSVKQLKSLFKEELKTTIDRVNDLYLSEVLKLEKIFKSEIIGNSLLQIVQTINNSGWILLMKKSGAFAYKCFSPMHQVSLGYTAEGIIKEFEDPICSLKGIYVNILHPKIMYGSIMLSTLDQHPNCDKPEFGTACNGTLEGRIIPLDNPQELLGLLNEIEATYKVCHLESAYYTPDTNFNIRKEESLWKATGT